MTDEKPFAAAPDPDAEPALQQRAIEALLLNPSHALAADATGVSALTLSRWMQQPEFFDAWSAACRFAFWQRLLPLLEALPQALEKLKWLLQNPEAPKASLLFRVMRRSFSSTTRTGCDSRLPQRATRDQAPQIKTHAVERPKQLSGIDGSQVEAVQKNTGEIRQAEKAERADPRTWSPAAKPGVGTSKLGFR